MLRLALAACCKKVSEYEPADSGYRELRDEFLDLYEKNITRGSTLFPGVPALLDEIEARGLPWGIVTNKSERFTLPLLRAFRLLGRAACVVCGDTTPYSKPHPAPLIEAMSQIGTTAAHCPYVGDDERRRAGGPCGRNECFSSCGYGYLGTGRPPEEWGADLLVDSPAELYPILFNGLSP
jgi:phosphoglycolate phosphatase